MDRRASGEVGGTFRFVCDGAPSMTGKRNGVAVELKSSNNSKNMKRGKRLEDDIRNGHCC
jgi:hypothetical protein